MPRYRITQNRSFYIFIIRKYKIWRNKFKRYSLFYITFFQKRSTNTVAKGGSIIINKVGQQYSFITRLNIWKALTIRKIEHKQLVIINLKHAKILFQFASLIYDCFINYILHTTSHITFACNIPIKVSFRSQIKCGMLAEELKNSRPHFLSHIK